MEKKRFIISFIELFLSAAPFVVVSFAWFVNSTTVDTSPIGFDVAFGEIEEAQMTFYTKNAVYRYDSDNNVMLIYDNGSWVLPSYTNPINLNHNYEGLFIQSYDPIIEENNVENFVFLELYMNYQLDENKSILIQLYSDTTIAIDAIAEFGYTTSRPYYLSEVSRFQLMANTNYTGLPEGTNIFENLFTDFSDTITYPYNSFYDITDTYNYEFDLGSVALTASPTMAEMYIYIKFDYFSEKVDSVLSSEVANLDDEGLRFFQDIQIFIKEDDTV